VRAESADRAQTTNTRVNTLEVKLVKVIKTLLFAGLVFALALAGWLYHFAHAPLELPRSPFNFTLTPGSSVKGIGRKLVEVGLLREPWSFVALARATGKAARIKAGDYELTQNPTPLQLLDQLIQGQSIAVEVKFIEGNTFAQLRSSLESHPNLNHTTKGLSDGEVLKLVGAEEPHPEGLFFPDTYFIGDGSTDVSALKLAYKTMKKHLAKEWESRDASTGYATPYEALIMASIVERETAIESERPLVAAVFVNRLRKNMRLQTDPTVIYGMGERFDGNLRKQDLTTDTPYNTYTRAGLPPTPIAMPGLSAINAALNPASSHALYFVARGDGSHEFTSNLADHNRAVAKFQKR
jgi:UPF0755 protein